MAETKKYGVGRTELIDPVLDAYNLKNLQSFIQLLLFFLINHIII